MTYLELFDLKFQKGFSTQELMEQYPDEVKRISEIALMDVNETTLRDLIPEKKILHHLMYLKKKFSFHSLN